jgi:hypothetical protein
MNNPLTVSEVRHVKQDAEDEIAAVAREVVEDVREKTGAEVEQVSLLLRTATVVDGSDRVIDVDVDISLDI